MANVSKSVGPKLWRAWTQVCWGAMGIVTFASCASQSGQVAQGRACSAELRDVQVVAEQRPDEVLVRLTAAPGANPEVLMDNAPMIAEALMREDRNPPGPSQQVRPAPGREVRISRMTNGVEMSFASNGILGLRGLRKRINDRVVRWQKGECPSLERSLHRPDVAQASSSDEASSQQAVSNTP